MADIVDRLHALLDDFSRDYSDALEMGERPDLWDAEIDTPITVIRDAASEIERLRSALTEIETYLDKRDAALRAAEREECAKVAEHLNVWGLPLAPEVAERIAAAIRARTESRS